MCPQTGWSPAHCFPPAAWSCSPRHRPAHGCAGWVGCSRPCCLLVAGFQGHRPAGIGIAPLARHAAGHAVCSHPCCSGALKHCESAIPAETALHHVLSHLCACRQHEGQHLTAAGRESASRPPAGELCQSGSEIQDVSPPLGACRPAAPPWLLPAASPCGACTAGPSSCRQPQTAGHFAWPARQHRATVSHCCLTLKRARGVTLLPRTSAQPLHQPLLL